MARTARSIRTYDRSAAILARAMFAGKQAREYVFDGKGTKIRKFTKDAPCHRDDIRELLVGVRAVTREEALEVIGAGAFNHMKTAGYLSLGPDGLYWVTKAAAHNYDLPWYMGARTFLS